ncbi:putative 26S proteasome regulatory subunit [Coemansia thaxteri]|uniref:Probable 26S proteasome regulatory subunit p27 n=1 Tax=Coemansia thaxteri TaxID=2663907 RepID=A0A9W8BJ26_9FUNG|nr:putative 26S proteasome regulatory subunit [Coemansia thaxteri]KAJ2002930.1 putative 26S proteasome regulatory subunit [Coemansia thaxteri]KAJ2470473.1 putative 26S proteasome regulatory subunit [Coemansia sp. RSA 2322]KAJ2483842.1 putative 26S proteasome regulatory subunit [Coemansia sp. RSA 2320]
MEHAQSLLSQKDELENEICALVRELESHKVTRTEELVDSNGFPRSDIDIVAIREIRRSLNCKQNDLKGLMGEIEMSLICLHQTSQDGDRPKPQPTTTKLRPFARISMVEHNSPASEAGLLVGDKIVSYGLVNAGNHNGLRLLIEETSSNIGKSIDIAVERVVDGEPQPAALVLSPRRNWGGDGLLGCYILPL